MRRLIICLLLFPASCTRSPQNDLRSYFERQKLSFPVHFKSLTLIPVAVDDCENWRFADTSYVRQGYQKNQKIIRCDLLSRLHATKDSAFIVHQPELHGCSTSEMEIQMAVSLLVNKRSSLKEACESCGFVDDGKLIYRPYLAVYKIQRQKDGFLFSFSSLFSI